MVDPATGLLWRFGSRWDAAQFEADGLTIHNAWAKPDGPIIISTFGGNS